MPPKLALVVAITATPIPPIPSLSASRPQWPSFWDSTRTHLVVGGGPACQCVAHPACESQARGLAAAVHGVDEMVVHRSRCPHTRLLNAHTHKTHDRDTCRALRQQLHFTAPRHIQRICGGRHAHKTTSQVLINMHAHHARTHTHTRTHARTHRYTHNTHANTHHGRGASPEHHRRRCRTPRRQRRMP
jgi:hypothetical protein